MSQSTIIAATLVAAFVLFITARGRLPTYIGVLWGASQNVPQPSLAAQANASANNGIAAMTATGGNPLGPVISTIAEILPFIGG